MEAAEIVQKFGKEVLALLVEYSRLYHAAMNEHTKRASVARRIEIGRLLHRYHDIVMEPGGKGDVYWTYQSSTRLWKI